jgi:peptide subunit release factor RF-3
VNLLYDEAADLVVLQDSSHKIELISEKLDGFGIGDSKFQYLEKKDANSTDLLRTGFYQLLVEGSVSLYKKESKKITEKIVGNELSYIIETSTYYYLLKQNRYTEIQSKKTIFRLLKDKEKELKKFAKTQHLNYRKDKDNMLSNVVENYNLLTK